MYLTAALFIVFRFTTSQIHSVYNCTLNSPVNSPLNAGTCQRSV